MKHPFAFGAKGCFAKTGKKSPQVIKHVVKGENGLVNPRIREEQARLLYCENARFREALCRSFLKD